MDFYEFFAGGGMARLGLGDHWRCLFANDIDETKAGIYRTYFGDTGELCVQDINDITLAQIPGQADLAWASFPCQDLSLAGNGLGLEGDRSGTFWPFWRVIQGLQAEQRAPKVIVLENVYGTVTSHDGRDLAAICESLAAAGYRYAPLIIDAQLFLPHSRPRLFIATFGPGSQPPANLIVQEPINPWHPKGFQLARKLLSKNALEKWIWINLPMLAPHGIRFADIIENNPIGVDWQTPEETQRLLNLMSPLHLEKVREARHAGTAVVGTIYKRTRPDENGIRRQRAEVRFDGVAGCLRTPMGGSSRQIVLVVDGDNIRSRLLSPREAARLMGLPEDYPLPDRYNDAYHLAGDGVAVPVVAWLRQHLIEPALIAIEEVA